MSAPILINPTPEFFERIPTDPGVYLMKDDAGRVIYVGKAKNLRTRVRQYFRPGGDERFFVAAGLLRRVLADIDTVVVDNEKEALLLENHLIKKHQPRFNVNLRDDKQYLVLRIDAENRYPRVEVVRNIKDDRARYFGPYHSATSCRATLRVLNRHFQLRTCTDHVLENRTRPCLQYQIKRCPAPCVYPVPENEYGEQVDDAILFLAGKNDELVPRLQDRMGAQADREEFERAAQLRDQIGAIEKVLAKQLIVQENFVDQDVFGLWRRDDVVEVVVLFIRGGKVLGRRSFRKRDQEFPDAEVMGHFVQQYYTLGAPIPDEVIVATDIDNRELIGEWLHTARGRKVKILTPKRGPRVRLVALANKNAAASAASRTGDGDDALAALSKLQRRLALKRVPRRIECFDIAHIQGTATVASMAVFTDGSARPSLYRKFKVRTVANDDFAAMYEVLTRRFKRALSSAADSDAEEPADPADPNWGIPDLLVVDGGKGQLNQALTALADLGIEITPSKGFDVIGLAKERDDIGGRSQPDRVFLPNVKEPIRLRPNTTELFLLSRIRDEAHRFANTFHKKTRKKQTLRSQLDDVPGIGSKRRQTLLRHFGSLRAIREATVDQLAAAPSMNRKVAEAVVAYFARSERAKTTTATDR